MTGNDIDIGYVRKHILLGLIKEYVRESWAMARAFMVAEKAIVKFTKQFYRSWTTYDLITLAIDNLREPGIPEMYNCRCKIYPII